MGYILAGSTAIPCLLASLCFYKAGTYYIEIKTQIEKDKQVAFKTASISKIDLRSESIQELQVRTMMKKYDQTRIVSSSIPNKIKRSLLAPLNVAAAEELNEDDFNINQSGNNIRASTLENIRSTILLESYGDIDAYN